MIEKLANFIEQFKQDLDDKHFNLSEIITSFFDYLLKHHLISTNFDDVSDENLKRKKRRICWFNYIFIWFSAILYILIILKFEWMFLNSVLPPKLNVLIMMIDSYSWFTIVIRHDFLMADIKDNLNAFKPFYRECKENYKLNRLNYKQLSILAGVLYYFLIKISPLIIFVGIMFTIISISYITGSLLWVFLALFEIYTAYVVLTAIFCFVYLIIIVLTYYRMLFNQINSEINKIIKLNTRKSLIRLTQQIREHHAVSVEIDELNKSIRRSIAFIFLIVSVGQVFLLYMLIKVDVLYVKVTVIIIFISCCISSLLVCTLLSLQIKAAHQSYNQVISFISNPKLSYRIKWKVRNNNVKIFI